ncbi:cytochrome C [Sphingobium lactosutens]|nr:cytochrome C [Sphingobium lactosutens]
MVAPAVFMISVSPAAGQMVVPKAKSMTSQQVFGQQCGACHSDRPGEVRVGPSLAGLVGRKAGIMPGFVYSSRLKASRKIWSVAELDRWLTNSQTAVPGTTMNYAQPDQKKRALIIDYLTKISRK